MLRTSGESFDGYTRRREADYASWAVGHVHRWFHRVGCVALGVFRRFVDSEHPISLASWSRRGDRSRRARFGKIRKAIQCWAPTVTTMILFTVQESRLAPNIGLERLSRFAHFGVEQDPYLLRQGELEAFLV
jgi:hypothetical protein